jgi:hypothetical protein
VHAQAGAASGLGDASPAATIPAAEDTTDPAFSAAAMSDAVAEISLKTAAMPAPAAVHAQAGATSGFGDVSPAAAISAAEDTTDHAFSAGAGLRSAALPGTPSSASSVASSGDIYAASAQEPVPAPCIDSAVNAAVAGASPAIPPNPFRASAEGAGKVFRGSETPPSPILSAAGTSQLSPCKGVVGIGGLEGPEAALSGSEKEATLGKNSARIAATSSPPSTPTPKPRKKEEVIAFGGISERMASPIRSSQRVRMQHNGDATQMERATQLAKKRLHTFSPGTKSKLSFSKLSDHEIVARATILGVSLGSNESEINNSIDLLKHTEEDRRITYLQNNLKENLGEENDCDILDTANQLCLDLELEDRVAPMGDAIDPVLSMPNKMLKKRSKKNISTLGMSVRRSTRINNFKKS